MLYAFVILQYQTALLTKACVDSILALEGAENIRVVISDNGSTNGAGREMAEHYADNPGIKVIFHDVNVGFSRANNSGFAAAVAEWDPDFVIVANNDAVFAQSGFLQAIDDIYKREGFFVLGPDILQTTFSEHQSPVREAALTLCEAEKARSELKSRLDNFGMVCFKKRLGTLLPKKLYNKLMKKYRERSRPHVKWDDVHYGACMFGACHIFSKKFTAVSGKAYYPETHFYYEEDMLAHRCALNGWKTVYDPSVQILHMECGTVDKVDKSVRANMRVKLKNMYDALGVYIGYLKQTGGENAVV